MSKITFRADDDLVAQLEAFDASKSEVMREALRTYLEDVDVNEAPGGVNDGLPAAGGDGSLEDLVAERVDDVLADRLDESFTANEPRDVNVNITLDGDSVGQPSGVSAGRKTAPTGDGEATDADGEACKQCGAELESDGVYCSNCGAKASHRLFCECGDELRSDWGFCPSCGRRTPAADVLGDT